MVAYVKKNLHLAKAMVNSVQLYGATVVGVAPSALAHATRTSAKAVVKLRRGQPAAVTCRQHGGPYGVATSTLRLPIATT